MSDNSECHSFFVKLHGIIRQSKDIEINCSPDPRFRKQSI